jgi:hypothetical protein
VWIINQIVIESSTQLALITELISSSQTGQNLTSYRSMHTLQRARWPHGCSTASISNLLHFLQVTKPFYLSNMAVSSTFSVRASVSLISIPSFCLFRSVFSYLSDSDASSESSFNAEKGYSNSRSLFNLVTSLRSLTKFYSRQAIFVV